MYAQQSRTGVPELDAVLATAQMVTPDGGNTVAAQVAQAAQQKLSPPTTPPGIGALMPGVRQQARNAAQAAQPVTQAQMQQALQQSQMAQQSQGVAGLPAQNMRTFTAAQGGVVGYATGDLVSLPRRTGESDEEYALRTASMPQMPGETDTAYQRRIYAAPTRQKDVLQSQELQPTSQQLERNVRVQDKGDAYSQGIDAVIAASRKQAAPRPSAPPAAPSAPQGGIAQLVAPTPEGAMASARSTLGLGDTTSLRTKEDAYLAALKAQPATGQQGLAALQAQQADLQRMHEKAEKESNINSVIQQLLGRGEGSGGAARAGRAFDESENARRRTYGELQVANATKRDAIIDLQNARGAGNAKAALEAEQRIRAADLAIAKAEGDLAGHFATANANVYHAQMQAQSSAANNATQLQIARIQAAARNDPQSKEAMAMARVQQAINSSPMLKALAEQAKFDPSAAARYRVEEEALYKRVAPELFGAAGAAPAAASNDPLGLRR